MKRPDFAAGRVPSVEKEYLVLFSGCRLSEREPPELLSWVRSMSEIRAFLPGQNANRDIVAKLGSGGDRVSFVERAAIRAGAEDCLCHSKNSSYADHCQCQSVFVRENDCRE